jgi:WG containing repeat
MNRQITTFRFDDVLWDYAPQVTVLENGKYGIFDIQKNEYIIPNIYQAISRQKNNDMVCIKKEDKWGYFYMPQKRVSECIYDSVEIFVQNYGVVKKNGKYGAIDTLCIETVPCKYDRLFDNNYGKYFWKAEANVCLNGKFGRINAKNNVLVPIIYDSFAYFSWNISGLALYKVSLNQKFGIINNYGKEILPIEYDEIQFSNEQDYYAPLRLTKNGLTKLVKVYR